MGLNSCPVGMLSRISLLCAIAGCLLHATGVSAVGIKIPIPIIIDATTVFTVAFSFLVIFAILTGFQWLFGLIKVCGVKDDLPPDVSPTKYETGHLFKWLGFITVSLWWAQLIIYTIYVRNVFMQKPRRHFPKSAYVARYSLDEFTDFFMAASIIHLIHYRRKFHLDVVAPISAAKKMFHAAILFAHLAVVCYTTAFQSLSIADPSNDAKYLSWLTSYYVYTSIYAVMSVYLTIAIGNAVLVLKERKITDEPLSNGGAAPVAMLAHALFKIIMAALYSQFNNPKIDYDILRVFEVLILGLTYFVAIFGVLVAGSVSKEDNKKVKELKELEKASAAGQKDST